MLRHLVNLLLWILPPSRLFPLRRALLRMAGIEVGTNVAVCGRGWIYGRGRLRIGDDTWISPGVIFHSHLDAAIEIGRNCDIATGVEFVTGSHFPGSADRRAGLGRADAIVVKDGCWIGARALILGGTTTGSGVVVAAGAVVTRDIPDNVLVGGVPAVVKKPLA